MLKNYYHAKHIRRGLTLLLCLIFVLGAMPAFASEGETAAEGAAAAEAEAGALSEAAEAVETAESETAQEAAADAAEPVSEEDAAAPAEESDDPILTNRISGWPKAKAKKSDYVCLYDTTTGTVLLDKNMDVQTPPASLTKIMTTLVALENGNLDDMVAMTEAGLSYAVAGSSNLYTVEGESFALKDMLYGIMLASANDMAQQVAEYIGGGSVDNFVAMMNARAKELGCTGTNFVNACGMPADGHVSTAHDMALICAAAMKNKTFRKIIKTANYTIPATQIYAAREITNHHPSLSEPDTYKLKGVLGGKTGYTDAAGSCLATVVKRDKRTVICIALHAADLPTAFSDTKSAFTYAYSKWKVRNLKAAEGEEITEGGKVLTPAKKTISDCETEETVSDNGDGREKVETVYYWSGVPVGTSTVLREPAKEVTVSSAPAPAESTASGTAGNEAASGALSAEVSSAASAPETASDVQAAADMTAENVVQDEVQAAPQVQLPFGVTMNRTSFISIAVLALLILLGIILILLTIAFRKR
jgi:D-alanyl-D-alanine carboxypeptidase